MSPEHTGSEEVLGALEKTLQRGSARTALRFDIGLPDAQPTGRPTRKPGGSLGRHVKTMAGHAAGRAFDWGMRRAVAKMSTMLQRQPGIIDFAQHRCVYPSGKSQQELVVGDQHWHGAPGTPVDRLTAKPASAMQPLWLVDLVRGVVDAQEHGTEELDGRRVRRFSATSDLHRAADAIPYGMAIPSHTDRLDDLERISVDVWVDDEGLIRRIRNVRGSPKSGLSTTTLDLTEFSLHMPSDWSRIPVLPADDAQQ